jgi:hypothetical protein
MRAARLARLAGGTRHAWSLQGSGQRPTRPARPRGSLRRIVAPPAPPAPPAAARLAAGGGSCAHELEGVWDSLEPLLLDHDLEVGGWGLM